METALLIYLYITVGNILHGITPVVSVALAAYASAFILVGAVTGGGRETKYNGDLTDESKVWLFLRKYLKNAIVTFGVLVLCNSLYPDKEELAWIIGGATAVSIATTEEAKKLPDNVFRAANTFLEGVAEKGKEQEVAQ